ncbi:MAG: hypothetical protein ACXWK8_11920 [Myxococcaceae bacterium]
MRQLVSAGMVLVLGCSGSPETDVRSTGPTSFQGSSALFSLADAVVSGIPVELGNDGVPVSILNLEIADAPLSCARPDAGQFFPRYSTLGVTITRRKPGVVTAGRYEVDLTGDAGTALVSVSLVPFEAGCLGPIRVGLSGSVEFSRVDESAAEGSLDVSLHDGSRVQGAFAARRCSPPPGVSPLPDGGYPPIAGPCI